MTTQLRYQGFAVPYLVDETLREGVERTAFPISVDSKMLILRQMIKAGVRDFIVGCGPEEPLVWDKLHQEKELGLIPQDTKSAFIVLLNCWETAFEYFLARKSHQNWITDTVFSFGMITYKESDKTFERAISAFKELGAVNFKASILNNFRQGVSEDRYAEICRQIDWAASLGVKTIRINDSVGSLQPYITRWMCTKLVEQYPNIVFCLHAHNDNGMAVANAIESIQAGFQMIEGSLAGYGNRSGVSPLEQIVKICKTNNIQLGEHEIDIKQLISTAQLCEDTFLQVPNTYRPVSGIFETNSNFGVLNIPDFLNTNDDKEYFVNYVGLHPHTIRQALEKHYPEYKISNISNKKLWDIVALLQKDMRESIGEITDDYKKMRNGLLEFYRSSTYTPKQLAEYAYGQLATSHE